jgi:hypothetical protein
LTRAASTRRLAAAAGPDVDVTLPGPFEGFAGEVGSDAALGAAATAAAASRSAATAAAATAASRSARASSASSCAAHAAAVDDSAISMSYFRR